MLKNGGMPGISSSTLIPDVDIGEVLLILFLEQFPDNIPMSFQSAIGMSLGSCYEASLHAIACET
jgi:hypothetical protein